MPPSRRSGQGAASHSQQSTISFGARSRVIKPSATSTPAKKAKDIESVADTISSEIAIDSTQSGITSPSGSPQPAVSELVVRVQTKAEIEQPRLEEDERALKITNAGLKRYWKREEEKRRAPQGCSLR
jgi:DNA polymerase delta subunit 4